MPRFKLISAATCPFVQRSTITLQHKAIAHEVEYVDLGDKPSWFLELSPTGKVPVLVVRESDREVVLFESAVINEYLDEVTEGSLLPADPLDRAKHRAMIELVSAAIGDAWRMATAGERGEALEHAAKLRAKLERFEAEIIGPFYAGDELTLVDTAAIPMLQRAAWPAQVAPELAPLDGLAKVQAWLAAAETLEAVQRSAPADLRERYLAHFSARESSWVGSRVRAA